MEIRHVQEFVVLAEIRNYARAAEELYMTQATLSRHIMSLEKELGEPLFFRTTRKVELTAFGADFLPYARRFSQVMEECEADLLSGEPKGSDKLVVGLLGPTLLYDEIRNALERFALENPEYGYGIVQSDEAHLRDRLRRRECNLIILCETESHEDDSFEILTAVRDTIRVILPAAHPLAGEKQVSLERLAGDKFILPPEDSLIHHVFVERCRAHGFEPEISSAMRDRNLSVYLASKGFGVAVLSGTLAHNAADASVSVVELLPPIRMKVNILYPRQTRLPASTSCVLKYFMQEINAKTSVQATASGDTGLARNPVGVAAQNT